MYIKTNNDLFECFKAIKGNDYIECLNKNNERIILFQGISDFSNYEIQGGTFTIEPIDDITQLQLAIAELAEMTEVLSNG